jgi:hypothetical protein
MAKHPRNIYELMNWAAEQHDLDPSQRKELYEWLETEEILDSSDDPWKEASRYAKELKKEAEALRRSRKKSAASEKGAMKGARKKSKDDIDEIQEDITVDLEGASEAGSWYEEDVDREDYPDYYDSDY